MADDNIIPSQPVAPSPPVRPPEQRKDRKKQRQDQHTSDEETPPAKPKEDHRGEWIDEYV